MISMPKNLPVQLMGPLGLGAAKADIENLQRALVNLAVATNRPQINPGAITGTVDGGTVSAVVAGLDLLTSELPTWAYLSLQAALVAGSATSVAKEAIGTYATQLTIAANTAAVKFKQNPVVAPVPTGFFAPGWYKTPAGLLLIGVAAFVVYKFVIAPQPAKTAA